MSKLTDFLHELLDHVGAGSLHGKVDALAKDEADTAVHDVATDVADDTDKEGTDAQES